MESLEERNLDELNHKEKKLIQFAKSAWDRTLQEFYFPPLSEPNYVFDYTHKESFYIDPHHQWQITMNLADPPVMKDDEDYIDYFFAISLHEVSHYQTIPYDGIINAKLLRSAMEHVNRNFAPIVVNLFSDLIIDKMLYEKYPDLMKWEIRKTYHHIKSKGDLSEFSKFIFRCYELLWKENLFEDDTLLAHQDLVERIIKIILKDFKDESKWERKVRRIAYHLKRFINNSFSLIGPTVIPNKGKSKRKAPGKGGNYVEIPDDLLELMDNPLESKNNDKVNEKSKDELVKKAEEFAKGVPYSEYGSPARQAGILIDAPALATWYRGIAKDLIEIKIFEEKPSGDIPAFPEVWRLGDPIEELDIVQTLLNSPIIIPNITTRKWKFEQGPGILEEKEIPDLLLVVDSSGSMGWNYTAQSKNARGTYHTALVAAFASIHHASKKGAKFSVINFSAKTNLCDWTFNYEEAERILLGYQGAGTVLPLNHIKNQCEKADNKTLVFIITDFGIYNWGKSKKLLLNLIDNGHKIVGFFIGSSKIPKDKFKDLLNKATFYPIKNEKALINLVIEEVKKYYN
ncbi:MAG: hypothetical protein BAJALOKI2v1_560009 [Promethearchaeota archaeon]|nr:MAG: hypothetical protein BAJALOKI2v1_560009 [Candidatus Lokiarchaeota archaeon]